MFDEVQDIISTEESYEVRDNEVARVRREETKRRDVLHSVLCGCGCECLRVRGEEEV